MCTTLRSPLWSCVFFFQFFIITQRFHLYPIFFFFLILSGEGRNILYGSHIRMHATGVFSSFVRVEIYGAPRKAGCVCFEYTQQPYFFNLSIRTVLLYNLCYYYFIFKLCLLLSTSMYHPFYSLVFVYLLPTFRFMSVECFLRYLVEPGYSPLSSVSRFAVPCLCLACALVLGGWGHRWWRCRTWVPIAFSEGAAYCSSVPLHVCFLFRFINFCFMSALTSFLPSRISNPWSHLRVHLEKRRAWLSRVLLALVRGRSGVFLCRVSMAVSPCWVPGARVLWCRARQDLSSIRALQMCSP